MWNEGRLFFEKVVIYKKILYFGKVTLRTICYGREWHLDRQRKTPLYHGGTAQCDIIAE
jgi:hypothetical protein